MSSHACCCRWVFTVVWDDCESRHKEVLKRNQKPYVPKDHLSAPYQAVDRAVADYKRTLRKGPVTEYNRLAGCQTSKVVMAPIHQLHDAIMEGIEPKKSKKGSRYCKTELHTMQARTRLLSWLTAINQVRHKGI